MLLTSRGLIDTVEMFNTSLKGEIMSVELFAEYVSQIAVCLAVYLFVRYLYRVDRDIYQHTSWCIAHHSRELQRVRSLLADWEKISNEDVTDQDAALQVSHLKAEERYHIEQLRKLHGASSQRETHD
jgi:hypothetical protein